MQLSEVPAMNYAGFWFRLIAGLVDGIISQILRIIILIPFGIQLGLSMGETATPEEVEIVGQVVGVTMSLLIHWLYFTVSESSAWQATLGKKMFGLKVTDMEGHKITFARANGRYWAKFLSVMILLIGFIMIAFTKKKQGLHDIIAGTLVLKIA